MRKIMKKITACTAAAALACTCAVSVSAETSDTFKDLDQAEFTAAMGLGWNLGNQLEAVNNGTPNETAWGNPVITEDLIKAVKAQGFSTIRVPVSYLSKIGDGPDYTVDEAWLDRVQEVVDYCVDNDMYVIINMHGDGYHTIDGGWLFCDASDEEQTVIKAKYESVWTQIAEKFKDYDEHLVFESMNEEFNNEYGNPVAEAYDNINDYNQIFVNAVRGTGSNNTKRWLLIPGWNTNIDYTAKDYGFELPEDSLCEADGNRIAVSVHFYDPYGFVLNEKGTARTQWGKYGDTSKKDNWGQEDHVDQQMQLLNEKFTSQGYPVIIGELGAIDKTTSDVNNNEFRRYWAEYVVKAAKANGCIPVYWDNGWNGNNGHGLFNRKDCTVTQQGIIDGMVRAISATEDYEIPAVTLKEPEDPSSSQPDTSSSSVSSSESSESSSTADSSSSAASSTDTSSAASSSKASSSSSKAASSSTTSNPSTGAAAAAFAVIAIAGAGVVITKKKNG